MEGFDFDDINDNVEPEQHEIISSKHQAAGGQDPQILNFTGTPGLSRNLIDVTSPLDCFDLFINDDDLRDIVHETDLCAAQQIEAKNLKQNSRFTKWVDTIVNERHFIALLFAMTLVAQLEISEYWTTDPVTSTSFFGDTIPGDRFYCLSFFCWNNNENHIPYGQEGHNPLHKFGRLYFNIFF